MDIWRRYAGEYATEIENGRYKCGVLYISYSPIYCSRIADIPDEGVVSANEKRRQDTVSRLTIDDI